MKICFYNVTATNYWGGLETYCWAVAEELALKGHQVTVVAGQGGATRSARVRLVQFPFTPRARFPDFGTRFRKLMERLSFARHAFGHLVSEGYDAIVVTKPYDLPALWLARRRGMRAQVVMSSGGTDFFLGDRFFARAATGWVAASRYNAAQIEARFRKSPEVIYNGVDLDRFTPRAGDRPLRSQLGMPADGLLLFSVGRLVGWKGLHIVVEAMAPLAPIHFAIVGAGAEESRLHGVAAGLGISHRVHLLGTKTHDELPALLAQGDLLVQPSIGEEIFGISMIEAMACGLPVFASRNGGIIEVVNDGETGRLLPPGEVAAWRHALRLALEDRQGLKAMGQAGRRRVENEFAWSTNARKLEQLLQRHDTTPATAGSR